MGRFSNYVTGGCVQNQDVQVSSASFTLNIPNTFLLDTSIFLCGQLHGYFVLEYFTVITCLLDAQSRIKTKPRRILKFHQITPSSMCSRGRRALSIRKNCFAIESFIDGGPKRPNYNS